MSVTATWLRPAPEALAARRVLVVGDVMLDRYWHGAVDRISPEAPVPVVRVNREEERLGGAANVALNVRALGAQATLLTVVGDDEPARRLRTLLEAQDVRAVLGADAQLRTIVKLRVIGRQQQLVRIDFENQPTHEVLAQLLDDFERELPSHDAVLFSDYGKGGLAHVGRMITMASEAGKPVLVDPKGSDYSRYAGADLITPNRAELAQVVGPWGSEDELRERARALRDRLGLAALLLTRSEEGMTLYDAEGERHVDADAREVFDVTGAGDTVIATMAALIAAGLPARDAMPWANRAGGIVVGRFGTASVGYDELFA
ncbi:D-glycero-beta-D-manno-heptose-7-phosphate kinase [Rubrivivax gelatinosus]|uniref:D-alpha,beta-D-heptose 7-phosphate 1-kinase RfaE n=1 Tax=Rubrivivax gelatinosus (strain NBRC 100245 / IL144) TaxID=983917 RepID=I0HNX7_RUBGI|nr:D-glycero-beta-D-manno-heptose-7-phosphate kinase [Rubrivivax gelatinosus]BAL94714.1 D-alpha,beta-D-heptose 7-phosphate 1-kinase RfaE [Rubrivivax gelatinosus IL144]